ncbi:MAG: polysaccharide deacetylase family protein [Selenomonas sp.]|nr:polysaccharide deacetylase family protein [Selenomonas sp.]
MRKQYRWLLAAAAVFFIAVIGVVVSLFQSAKGGIPVLNYHQINDTEKNALTVNTEQFEAQMKYLSENGYTAITPADMLDAWENGTQLPEKPVIITFDDGYLDNYNHAFPVLEKYQLKATIFLISDYVNTYPNYLTWSAVQDMQQSGLIDFESHTLSHEELTKAPDLDEAKHQLTGSKQAIEWNLGKQVNFIAYPCGEYNDDIEQATKDAGYRAAFTVNYGLAEPGEDPFILDRVPIFGSNSHTLARFKLRLTLAPLFAPLNKVKMELREDHPTLASFILVP